VQAKLQRPQLQAQDGGSFTNTDQVISLGRVHDVILPSCLTLTYMPPPKKPQPQFIHDAVRPLADELSKRAALQLEEMSARLAREAGEFLDDGATADRLLPPLMQALIDQLTDTLNAQGRDYVRAYTAARTAEGVSGRHVHEHELGPLMGLSRAGVNSAFRNQPGGRRSKATSP
jgi:hypothetical protein